MDNCGCQQKKSVPCMYLVIYGLLINIHNWEQGKYLQSKNFYIPSSAEIISLIWLMQTFAHDFSKRSINEVCTSTFVYYVLHELIIQLRFLLINLKKALLLLSNIIETGVFEKLNSHLRSQNALFQPAEGSRTGLQCARCPAPSLGKESCGMGSTAGLLHSPYLHLQHRWTGLNDTDIFKVHICGHLWSHTNTYTQLYVKKFISVQEH